MSRRETAAELKARIMGKPEPAKKPVQGPVKVIVFTDFKTCAEKLQPLLAMPDMTGVPRQVVKGVIEFLSNYKVPESVTNTHNQTRIDELEKEIALLRAVVPSEGSVPVGSQPSGALPPPGTYAEAVRREFNRAKHAEARADKLNRAKMSVVSSEAARIRLQEKERALREKFKEGYIPLDVRKNKQRIAEGAKSKKKPTSVVQKAALVAHTFVRFTRAQMREHQLQVLKMTGADRWFSAAERAAYKVLSPARKAEIKAARIQQSELIQAKKAAEREMFRKERAIRVAAMAKARVESLAKTNPKQVYKGKGRVIHACPGGCRFVINTTGTATLCRDCGRAGGTE